MNSNFKIKILFVIFAAILIICLFNIKVYAEGGFSLDKESLNVKLNGTGYLSPIGGSGTTTWTSSDPSVATVENGTIKGLKIGTATITATKGSETAECTVNVIYNDLIIGGNESDSVTSVNLILGEHTSETLFATARDYLLEKVSNPDVTWTSSDTSIVTVNNSTGTITGVKAGTATITATAAGVSDTCEVTVYDGPIFTDFSNAKYETTLNWTTETLQISGIKPDTNNNTSYYYIITSNNSKPNIEIKSNGSLDLKDLNNSLESFLVNSDGNSIYTRKISKYAELNQDLYIWILQDSSLSDAYFDTNQNSVYHSTKFVVEGKKITRAELPQLNLILQSFDIWHSSDNTVNNTSITFNFPSNTENRKFKIKIGKVTDNSILLKIQNNDYSGITELLSYAKNNDAIYSQTLTTTNIAHFRSDTSLFDGNKLLENKAYYYVYVEFDDENEKYYPIEGVTLGQAHLYQDSDYWYLYAYTSNDFQWDNLSPASLQKDPTTANVKLPHAGIKVGLVLIIITLIAGSLFTYFKYNRLKNI